MTTEISGQFFFFSPCSFYPDILKFLISFQVLPVSAERVSCLISKREMEEFNTQEGEFITGHNFLLLSRKKRRRKRCWSYIIYWWLCFRYNTRDHRAALELALMQNANPGLLGEGFFFHPEANLVHVGTRLLNFLTGLKKPRRCLWIQSFRFAKSHFIPTQRLKSNRWTVFYWLHQQFWDWQHLCCPFARNTDNIWQHTMTFFHQYIRRCVLFKLTDTVF